MEEGDEGIRRLIAAEIARFEIFRPPVTPDICAVHVFSGPGTVLEPFSDGDSEWTAWCDARCVQRGILLVLEVTAMRLKRSSVREVSKQDVENTGPLFIYNGVPDKYENADLRSLVSLPRFPIPESRLVIIDEVEDNGRMRGVIHTGDQVKSFPTHVLDGLEGVVALVSNAPHFSRILRYLGKYRTIPERFRVRCCPLLSDPSWAVRYANSEIEALVEYLNAGYLAEEPYPADLGLS